MSPAEENDVVRILSGRAIAPICTAAGALRKRERGRIMLPIVSSILKYTFWHLKRQRGGIYTQYVEMKTQFWVLTYCSWPWIGHLAWKFCPFILRPVLMQEVPFKSSKHIFHSVNTHCWTIQDIAEESSRQKESTFRWQELFYPLFLHPARTQT